MVQFALIGVGAGLAAAVLFASLKSASLLSMVLFYLAPLPIMIAALGWSHWSALIGALTGAIALGAVFGPVFFSGFLAYAGLPAWWLGYLAMLARPAPAAGNGGEPALEWYPPGRLLMWATLAAMAMIGAAIIYAGPDAESFRGNMHHLLTEILRVESGASAGAPAKAPSISDSKRLIEFLVAAIPPTAVVVATLTNVLNLWLAGRIVRFSGRLTRPWPALAATTLPRPLAPALVAAIALSFMGGMIGILASVAAAALVMAFGLLGFAVLHAVTQGMSARPFLLGGLYAAVLVFGWPLLVLSLLGLIETTIDLRARVTRMRQSPPSGG
jgi:hypothetical protein